MDTLELIRSRLEAASRPELKRVAEYTGVPFHTLRKIISGETGNPRIATIEPLRRYCETLPRRAA